MEKNILLISPAAENEALWITGTEGPEVINNAAPLALVTIAAMTPPNFHVDIWDEIVHGIIDDQTIFDKEYDLAAVTGYKAHFQRCRQLAEIFRKRRIPIAVGGPGVSATPDEYQKFFDILFIGEAERTWPQFLQDWLRGVKKSEYRQIESVEMSESPIPRWDLIAKDIHKYSLGAIQTTRGCPFDCEFCDVVYLFGRRPRHKPIANVLKEVRLLEQLGLKSVFFCDDEFIGDPPYAKELLRSLIVLNETFQTPLTFSTQLTLRVSKDDELLELLADANFDVLFIGIETPNQESLRESHKLHNLGTDLVEKVHKIQSYGIIVRSGIIVGFDHDDSGIFDMQYQFIQNSFIPSVAINMLKAPFGTKLWSRLRAEGRVVKITPEIREKLGHPRSYTSIIPKQMTRIELMKGYRRLTEKVFSWPSFGQRVMGFIDNLKRVPTVIEKRTTVATYDKYPQLYGDSDEAREVITAILSAAGEKAPAILSRIAALVVQHAKYRKNIIKLLPQIDRQIEMEEKGEIVFDEDRRVIPMPESFRKAYREIFPEIYQTVADALHDDEKTARALVDIFVAFLTEHGKRFQGLEEKHHHFLNECINKTVEKMNTANSAFSPSGRDRMLKGKHKIDWLGDDIMKNVHQILVNRTSTAEN